MESGQTTVSGPRGDDAPGPAPVSAAGARTRALNAGRRVLTLGAWAVVGLAIAVATLIVAGPRLGVVRTVTVLSGSMRPTWDAGDLLVETPEPLSAVHAGQSITYQAPIAGHPLVTHRVIRVLRRGAHPVVQTKGDANSVKDPWTARLETGPLWRVRLVVPKAGWAVATMHDRIARLLAIVAVPLLLLAYGMVRIWGRPDGEQEAQPA